MEQLFKRSDGIVETPSGLYAVVPLVTSGVKSHNDGTRTRWFDFKTHVLGKKLRLEWPDGLPLVIIDAGVASGMVAAGYAAYPSEALVSQHNASFAPEKVPAQAPAPVTAPVAPEPVPAPVAPVFPSFAAPSQEQTPAEPLATGAGPVDTGGVADFAQPNPDAQPAPPIAPVVPADWARPRKK